MGNRNQPIIMPEDMDLFFKISKHGYVDLDYICLFCYPGRKKNTIQSRIRQLELHNYLNVTKTFIPASYTVNYRVGYSIIALGNLALKLIYSLQEEVKDYRKAIQTSSPYRMYHQVQISTLCDMLKKEYEKDISKWQIEDVWSEREAYMEDASNQPDAVIIFKRKDIEDSPYILIFVEMERSYSTVESLKRKITSYSLSFQKDLYVNKLNKQVIDQRILFISQTDNQLGVLNKKLQELNVDSCKVLLASYHEVIENSLSSIYRRPKNEEKYKLLQQME